MEEKKGIVISYPVPIEIIRALDKEATAQTEKSGGLVTLEDVLMQHIGYYENDLVATALDILAKAHGTLED